MEKSVYLIGETLRRYVPLPRPLRSYLGVQILGVGKKP
jgi:hypothetical protein